MNPTLAALRATEDRAWRAAYPLLWETGMNVALCRLAGSEHAQDREDAVATALSQLMKGLLGGANSFNQMASFDDLLGMMRHITRQRLHDHYRASHKSPVVAVEELPDLTPSYEALPRFHLSELMTEVARLEPDPPVPGLFHDRFVEGWSTDEIAQRRSMNRNTVLSHFAKGFRTLRERLTRLEGTATP